jgi:hypothetical protein
MATCDVQAPMFMERLDRSRNYDRFPFVGLVAPPNARVGWNLAVARRPLEEAAPRRPPAGPVYFDIVEKLGN